MSIGTRIKELRIKRNITQEELAKRIGVTKGAIANYENEISSPKIELMYKLFDALNCDANYLHQDDMKGYIYKETATPEEFETIIRRYRDLDDAGKEHIRAMIDWELSRAQQLQNAKIHQTPAATRIYTYMHKIACAGSGYYFDDIPTDTMEAPYQEDADFIFGVSGDSMEPSFSDGDLVYVQKKQILSYGEIGIFILNGECLIKEAGEAGLISHNKKYDVIPGSEDIICVGKVLGKVETE